MIASLAMEKGRCYDDAVMLVLWVEGIVMM